MDDPSEEKPASVTYSGGAQRRYSSATVSPKPQNSPSVTYELVEKMIAVSEAKLETKLVELRGHVDGLRVELGAQLNSVSSEIKIEIAKKPGTGAFIATVLAAIAVVVGVLAFGGDRFDGGVQLTSVSVQQAQEARDLAKQNAEQIQTILGLIGKQSAIVEPQSKTGSEVKTPP